MTWKPIADMTREDLENEVRQLRTMLERFLIDLPSADSSDSDGTQDPILIQSTDTSLSRLLERRRASPSITAEEGRQRIEEMLARRRAELHVSHDSKALEPDATDDDGAQ